MTPDELKQFKALYVATAMYFDQRLPDQVLSLYVEDLADLPYASVARAIGEARRDPKTTRCPLPSQVRSRVVPQEDPEGEATLVASDIVGAVSRIGPYRAEAARRALGPVAWQVVEMEGGWESLCRNLTYDTLGTFKAQARKLAEVLIRRGVGKETEAPQLPEPPSQPTGGLIDMRSFLKNIPGGKV